MKALRTLLLLFAAVTLTCSCEWFGCGSKKKYDKVLIVYGAGFTNLSSEIIKDINELKKGDLPTAKSDVAIIIVNHAVEQGGYKNPTQPRIMRLYKDKKQITKLNATGAVLDTLMSLANTDLLTKHEVMNQALSYIAAEFKSDHYGLIFSSHGTGWLPPGYYESPSTYDKLVTSSAGGGKGVAQRLIFPDAVPYVENVLPGPRVRSFGEELYYNEKGARMSQSMDIRDFAEAIPFHADYIFMDACLMGCVEVAYELKDKCDYIGFSPAEILEEGLTYDKVAEYLLKGGDPDLMGLIDEFFDHYNSYNDDWKSFTYSLVNCRNLEALASACSRAFAECREDLAKVNPTSIQPFFRYKYHWFYDLRDLLAKSGAGTETLSSVDAAIRQCVLKSVHTPTFLPSYGGFEITTCCGMTMYLPSNGSAYLDAYYRTLAWNKATSLVQ